MSKKGKGTRKTKPAPSGEEGDLSKISLEEVTYMLLLNADLSARNTRRATMLSNIDGTGIPEDRQRLIGALIKLREMIGSDAPLFPQPCIVTEPGVAHQLYQECYELAKLQAMEELKEEGQGK